MSNPTFRDRAVRRLSVSVSTSCLFFLLATVLLEATVHADEGMWLFNRLPTERLEERYHFAPDQKWAERVMRASVRISAGGSGSIVSPRGLVMTNHHVVSGWVQELSTAERNLVEEGFSARSPDEELHLPGAEVLALQEIVDVTDRMRAVTDGISDPAEAEKARRVEIAAIEKESKDATGLHSEVVTLYRGGEFHLYRYRRYDDVRLVFVPETKIAFFGGDTDNFEFPRHCLDVAFIRLWENGEPAHPEKWLHFSDRPVEAGDLIFVSGHPGRTQRLNTVAHLRFYRDVAYPDFLRVLYRREIALQQYSLGGGEAERVARDDLFSIQNSRKAVRGILAGLLHPPILAEKKAAEARLQAAVAASPDLGASVEDWTRIAAAMSAYEDMYNELMMLENGRAFWSELAGWARTLVRLAEEIEKPDGERLPEYRESALPRLRARLTAEVPVDPELETAKLTDSLTYLAEMLGADHPLVRLILDGKAPGDRAHELVAGTRLASVERRKELLEGGPEAIRAPKDDAMLELASTVDPFARSLRERHERLVESVLTETYGHIARASFAATGTSVYPDATFTLRLAYGTVAGWTEAGRDIPAFTRIEGAYELYDRFNGEEPYELPESWLRARDKIDGQTHFNFVSTADIIGGNSGSPVINRDAEVVGLIFDGNIHGLVLDISYTEDKARAVAVDASAIVEALQAIYGMESLVKELTGS